MIESINRQAVPRVAIDIPSGLNGLTGNAQPVAVVADLTVTFIGAKTGQYLADGPDFCGELLFEDLGVSRGARAGIEPRLEIVESCELPPPRKKTICSKTKWPLFSGLFLISFPGIIPGLFFSLSGAGHPPR